MTQLTLFAIAYLAAALGIEHGFLPLVGHAFGSEPWSQTRLIALGVILAAALRGEAEALPFAVISAILAGCAAAPGQIGCLVISYSIAAYAAGIAARWLDMNTFSIRFFVLLALIVGESWIFSGVRHLFWREWPIEIQWPAHLAVTLVGTLLYVPLAGWLVPRPRRAEARNKPA